jgi:hypothetical protein
VNVTQWEDLFSSIPCGASYGAVWTCAKRGCRKSGHEERRLFSAGILKPGKEGLCSAINAIGIKSKGSDFQLPLDFGFNVLFPQNVSVLHHKIQAG